MSTDTWMFNEEEKVARDDEEEAVVGNDEAVAEEEPQQEKPVASEEVVREGVIGRIDEKNRIDDALVRVHEADRKKALKEHLDTAADLYAKREITGFYPWWTSIIRSQSERQIEPDVCPRASRPQFSPREGGDHVRYCGVNQTGGTCSNFRQQPFDKCPRWARH